MASKTPLIANQSFKIDALGGDVTQATGDPLVVDGEVAVWIGNTVPLNARLSLINTISVMERYAQGRLNTLLDFTAQPYAQLACRSGGTEHEIVQGFAPAPQEIVLFIGTGTPRNSELFTVAVGKLKDTIREALQGN